MILVDVDALKDVNDTFGHAVGDDLLRAVARRMQRSVRAEDTVARVGGDEFVVLLAGVSGPDAAVELANRVRESVCRTPFDTGAGELPITASFGVASGVAGEAADELLRRADAAMYRAKSMGGGHVVAFDDAAEITVSTIADEFAVAVSHGLIRPHVQPIVNLRTGELAGYQGLARWAHPERGDLEAASFIDLVSSTAMAPVVDLAVLRRTTAVAARAARRGRRVRAYGHLSRRLIGDPRVDQYLIEIATDLALSPSDICVEIAHPLISRASRSVTSAMRSFRDAGVRVVLTDVEGECGADEIVEHGFDELRLSRRLVRDAATVLARLRVVQATVALAHALDLPVMAVGVETERDEAAMLDAGCDLAEGNFFGPVVPSGSAE